MKSHSLAAVGLLYSASTLLLLAALGALEFKEAFGLREVRGLSRALASVVVMNSGGERPELPYGMGHLPRAL
ncbi:MAG: hypothetical protein AAF566_03485 [Pseudomonadota bacterium]